MARFLPKIVAFFLFLFGLLTFYLSGSIIFDLFDVRAQQGDFVLFVVWVNFISSLIYLISSYGVVLFKRWVFYAMLFVILLLIGTFIGFNIFVNAGGIHEEKTMGAIIFRTMVTSSFAVFAYFLINKNQSFKHLS